MAKLTIPTSGLWSTIAALFNSMFDELFGRNGYASYTDTQYDAGAPFSVLANTDTILPNNAGIIYDEQKPTDITTFYDGKITGRDGDGLAVMIYFKATSSSIDQWLDIWIDIGGAVGELYRDTKTFPKGTSTERGILYSLPAAYTRSTWETNKGTVYVRSNAPFTCYGMNYNLGRTSKAR